MLERVCSPKRENESITTDREFKAGILPYGRIAGFFMIFYKLEYVYR
ncbi:MAG: hypothetical protein HON76_04120 [Candidatus Scalindua sp.]|jgi:hypothetical protein|nr:hypothetical protein [Candidatus Scalindua sp.]MBT6045639.1 hypothetical protein [Candidatus Scalindua sp.]MBT6227988.1 hypothetical protein [Candidatus Scalindua sp.]MBT6561696.1 hypothetical protein [Candidatus Scalindua sp.]MBT7211098.1 hypothetical protein [Candidatus Scalindua sp.]